MQRIRICAQRYSFPGTLPSAGSSANTSISSPGDTPRSAAHWQHLVAKLGVTIFATKARVEKFIVEIGDMVLEKVDCRAAQPALRCALGNILLVNSGKTQFQLAFDPLSFAEAIKFFEKIQVPVVLHNNQPETARRHPLMSSSRPSSSVIMGNNAPIPSSILHMASPQTINLCSTPVSFAHSVAQPSISSGELTTPISRYGVLFDGSRDWKFVFKTSHIKCTIKTGTMQLLVFAGSETIHKIELKSAPLRWQKTTIMFQDKNDSVMIRMNTGFITKLLVLLQTHGLRLEPLEGGGAIDKPCMSFW